jgi:YidC/Oxa1 family membrane protein insertase
MSSLGQLWHPIWQVWWTIFGVPMSAGLHWLVTGLSDNPLAQVIGPFGIAVVLLTVGIKVVLSPIFQFQLATSRRIQAEQRKIAPQMAAIRKKYKKDPQRLNQETMALYKEHGINPLSQMSGCLPAVVQAPILIALYWVIYGAQKTLHLHDHHFLWIPNIAATPSSVFGHAALGIAIGMLVLPVLAGLTTFVQTKMMTPPGGAAGQDPSAAQVTQSMTLLMPVMIGFFAINFPAALALYWVVSNLFSIGQQYFITGWGSLTLPGGGSRK